MFQKALFSNLSQKTNSSKHPRVERGDFSVVYTNAVVSTMNGKFAWSSRQHFYHYAMRSTQVAHRQHPPLSTVQLTWLMQNNTQKCHSITQYDMHFIKKQSPNKRCTHTHAFPFKTATSNCLESEFLQDLIISPLIWSRLICRINYN